MYFYCKYCILLKYIVLLVNTLYCSGLKKCIVEYKVDWIKKFQNQKRLVTPSSEAEGELDAADGRSPKGEMDVAISVVFVG